MDNRFENNDEFEFNGDEFNSYSEEDEMNAAEMLLPTELERLRQEEIGIINQKINTVVLRETINVVQRHWLWRFRRPSKKIQLIHSTYYALLDLVNFEKE